LSAPRCKWPRELEEMNMTLLAKLLILAIAAQVLMTIAVLFLMGRERVPRIMRGEIDIKDVAVDKANYPLQAKLYSNNFDNQFQLPVLFYLASVLALWAAVVDWLLVGLAWAFVVSRLVHLRIHVTTNRVHRRFLAYITGLVILVGLWVWLLVNLLFLTPSI
jgi:hypothetical protein